jgi:hypothetical protein
MSAYYAPDPRDPGYIVGPGEPGATAAAAPPGWKVFDPHGGPLQYPPERWWAPLPVPTNYSSQALEKSRVVFTGQCRLEGFNAVNTNASTRYIMVFDATAVPANGAVTGMIFTATSGQSVGVYWGTTGRWMQFGLVICNSTTQTSLTLGAADSAFDVQYTPLVF